MCRAVPFLACLLGLPAHAAGVASGGSDEVCPAGDPSCKGAVRGGAYYWPHQKGDINRTGLSPYPGPKRLEAGPTWRWIDKNLDVIRNTPLIDDRLNIYLATAAGRIYKFSPDGQVLWKFQPSNGTIPAVPVIMDGLLFANLRNGFVLALDMESGKERWRTLVSENIASDTACIFALNGTLVTAAHAEGVLGHNMALVALDFKGTVRWTFQLQEAEVYNFQASSPGDGTIVFQNKIGGVYRVDLATGRLIWFTGIPGRKSSDMTTGAAIVGPNGIVYAASNLGHSGVIHAYSLEDGSPLWRYDTKLEANQAVAIGRLAGSEGLSVVAGVGENLGLPAFIRFCLVLLDPRLLPQHWYIVHLLSIYLPMTIWCCCCCTRCKTCVRRRRCLPWLLVLVLIIMWIMSTPWLVHILALRWKDQPAWLWGTNATQGTLVALSAETGELRWAYNPPPFERLACESDTELLAERIGMMITDVPSDPICLPDSWAQAIIDADGTVYAGHQDGRIYAVRDEDGDGKISAETEVSSFDLRAAFQASQGMAPGMLAVAPCGGGLYVWRY